MMICKSDIHCALCDSSCPDYIEVEPVRHGHWVPTEQTPNFEWECSVCGNGFTNNKLSYCYDCGAKMDEAEE